MNRAFGVVLAIFVIALPAEVGALPQNKYISTQELDVDAIQNVTTIALLEAAEPEAYYFGGGKPGGKAMLFGTVGVLVEFDEMSKHGDKYRDIDFPVIVNSYIKEFLSENGYRIVEHNIDRSNKIDLLPDYSELDLPGVDAYLDVAPVEVGYLYKPTFSDEGIWPLATVVVRLVTAKSQQVIYARTFQYGYHVNTHSESEVLLPPNHHVYESKDELSANRAEANQRLVRALEVIALSVARELTIGDFASFLSPTMDDLESAGNNPVPVEFIGAAATEIALKNYDKKLWGQSGELAGGDAQKQTEFYIQLRARRLENLKKREELKALVKLARENPGIPEYVVDVSGTYVSDITHSGNAVKDFKRNNRKEVTLKQEGNKITGYDRRGTFEINGTRKGDVINFYVIRGNQIDGVWQINADATMLEGKWHTNGGGGASGIWNLKRIGTPAGLIENTFEISTASNQPLKDFSGTYMSRITGDVGYLDDIRKSPKVSLKQNGNKVTGAFGSFGGTFEGTIDGTSIAFNWYSSWTRGKGKWEFDEINNELVGTWKSGGGYDGSGKWILKRIE